MNSELFFEFKVDKPSKMVYISREFDANIDLVWDAFTIAELLDQWVAPAPFKAKTKTMNFEVGGQRFWAMISPDGKESWVLQTYKSIAPKTNFQLYNTFADPDRNPAPTGSDWDYTFYESGTKTIVNIKVYNESFERMESLLEGFQQGYTQSLENLDQLLIKLKNKKI